MMTEGAVLDAVKRETGLNNIHPDGLGDRLQRLLKHIDLESGMDEAGKQIAVRCIIDLLTSRALMLADRERYPEIADEVVSKPIIVTGMPRSGTTVMHALLGADPANRTLRYWEVKCPSPPPGISASDNQRIAAIQREVDEFCARNPLVLTSHPYWDYGADTITECEPIGGLDLRNVYNTYYYKVPTVLQINLMDDPLGCFDFHKKALQHLQWKRPAQRWALKGTEHHAYLGALKQVYPDSVVVWPHRDPFKVVPSLMALLYDWFSAATGKALHRPTLGRMVLGAYKAQLDQAMSLPEVSHPDVNHVMFADFMADPVAVIRKVYERHDIPFSPDTAQAMKAWLTDPRNAADRHGKFTYSLDDFEMTRDQVDAEFSAYRKRFNIPQEQ